MASRATRQHLRVDRLAVRCESFKVSYDSRAEALHNAEQQMIAGRVARGSHIVPYLCDRCGRWHLTNEHVISVPSEDVSRRAPRRRP